MQYRLSVNLVDQENRPVILNCVVHDTASSYLEIYMDEAIELGLDSEYHYLGPMIRLETSNGAVFRLTFQVEVQLMADGHEVAEKVTAMACLVNDISLGQSHASGPFIQKTLFTATHPKGDLLIGANKTAIANLYRGR
ncbi:hypothetical protein N7532_000086 [Penicillium argentinense]|uniref:Uncharacterized protein n=1 Tax=Penicillium argentinense TaxID=1131581 RepID=A0A9W9G4V5_9EURO|nr:uncharacterized protein N7532_000086 [Penicillium argentinense]KAJ5112041.1 hypothetical protein N7532_000086 [Penicillium argentinense]